jgi:hypothetical protein
MPAIRRISDEPYRWDIIEAVMPSPNAAARNWATRTMDFALERISASVFLI